MRAEIIQDRISRGWGRAAFRIGLPHDVLRPSGVNDPCRLANRVMRLPASFNVQDNAYRQSTSYGHALWYGVFDSAYVRPGDYLRGQAGVFFVAAQDPLLPVLCVRTNRTLSFARPAPPSTTGTNTYGGVTAATATPLMQNWPGAVLSAAGGAAGELPSDASIPYWQVMLPVLPVALRGADLISDDLGRSYVVSMAEQSALGWRLIVKQAAT